MRKSTTAWDSVARRRASVRAVAVPRSARVARMACQVLTAVPTARAATTSAAVIRATRLRRANLPNRYHADGGHASTGSSSRYRRTSAARPLAVSYRRVAVLLQALHHDPVQLPAHRIESICGGRSLDCAETVVSVAPSVLSRVLGLGGSSSRMIRRISS